MDMEGHKGWHRELAETFVPKHRAGGINWTTVLLRIAAEAMLMKSALTYRIYSCHQYTEEARIMLQSAYFLGRAAIRETHATDRWTLGLQLPQLGCSRIMLQSEGLQKDARHHVFSLRRYAITIEVVNISSCIHLRKSP